MWFGVVRCGGELLIVSWPNLVAHSSTLPAFGLKKVLVKKSIKNFMSVPMPRAHEKRKALPFRHKAIGTEYDT